MMKTDPGFFLDDYDYELPKELIAQHPVSERGGSRLLVLNGRGRSWEHARFADLPDHLPEGALLVVNNSRVAPVRLYGLRPSGGRAELLLLTPPPLMRAAAVDFGSGWRDAEAVALLKPGKSIHPGQVLDFGAHMKAEIVEKRDFGRHIIRFRWQGDINARLEESGHMPLPPYIKREGQAEDKLRYQTVYARGDKAGSVAAPTAGLHFTPMLRAALKERGFGWAEVTLHVGYGTFSPVREEDIRRHVMHREYVEIPPATARAVREAKDSGRPVIAVGTTTARSLEGTAVRNGGEIPGEGWQGWTDIFLYPGCSFHVVSGMITNFHLPKSSLLMLVSALAGREEILETYAEAIRERYRFFSYGDAMLINPGRA